MRIPLDILIRPGPNDLVMTAILAVSVFVFAYSTLFGPIAILLYYALWFPLAALAPGRVAAAALDGWVVVAFVAFALMSTLWSAAPGTTLRSGVQLATHAVCAFTAARMLSLRALDARAGDRHAPGARVVGPVRALVLRSAGRLLHLRGPVRLQEHAGLLRLARGPVLLVRAHAHVALRVASASWPAARCSRSPCSPPRIPRPPCSRSVPPWRRWASPWSCAG